MGFEGKVAVVTGGAQGIGRCVAEEFRKAGATVCVIDRQQGNHFVGDVADKEVLEQFAKAVIEKHGHVDYLVNNAPPPMRGIDACSYEEFQQAMSVGVTAAFYLTKLFAPYFAEGAAVVNISSSRDRMSQPQTESYTAAKGGIAALTHALAVSLAGKVRVNSISPGWIDTAYTVYEGPDAEQQPVGRVGNPLDIANMVLYLCSDKAGFITGENICIDGGMTRQMIYHGDHGWVRAMKRLWVVAALVMLTVTGWAKGFRNPVLSGFHADPSVCRAGDDFYLVNSTFQYFPGVPVFHSKDLIHWEQVGACLTRESQVRIEGMDEQTGIYAPTIRYHEGRFYMVTTVFPSRKHFYVYTDNPNGEWSDPIYIDFCIGSCDPTLFFDEGKCYFLWKEGDIKICEIDVETGKQLGEIHHLGVGLGGRYPEGPHIYRKDGYYYLLLAEGGTEHGHHVNILRSRNLFGPYEPNSANPILSHFNMKMQNSPIQGLGHADLVQAPDGSWWMICLGYRTHGYLQHVMGRETFLAPVTWEEGGWPVVNSDGTLQLDMECETLPQVPMPLEPSRDEFEGDRLSLYWSHLNMPQRENYSLKARKGWLRLKTSTVTLDEVGNPTFIGHRQSEANFTATTKVDVSGLKDGGVAGITAYAAHRNHYDVQVAARDGKRYVQAKIRIGEMEHIEKEITLHEDMVYLRITADQQFYHLHYSTDGEQFTHLARMDYRYLSTETIGGFCGVHLGIFAHTLGNTISHADFDWTNFEFQ